jgi:hypothetical protein
MFGLTGKTMTTITLHLSARAYLLVREEYPMACPTSRTKKENIIFSTDLWPALLALADLDEIEIVAPEEFREYVRGKVLFN